jgi:hypothetical protein
MLFRTSSDLTKQEQYRYICFTKCRTGKPRMARKLKKERGMSTLPLAKAIMVAGVLLSLGACTSVPADPDVGAASSVAEVRTKAGQSLVVAWRAFDAFLTAVDALRAGGVIKPGSADAAKLAELIERTRHALNAATDALRAGNGADFTQSLTLAQSALAEATAAIGHAK